MKKKIVPDESVYEHSETEGSFEQPPAEHIEINKIQDLIQNPKNPRKISDSQLTNLKKSLDEFGDLGCIVFNVRYNHLVGGNQRGKALPPDADIIITQRYDKPTRTGTVAEGHVVIAGEKFKYRAVDWQEAKELAAMVAANKQGGEWDKGLLEDVLVELQEVDYDMTLLGYEPEEVESILTTDVKSHERKLPDGSTELAEESFSEFDNTCPKCKFEFNNV